jgi:hypothetical protein
MALKRPTNSEQVPVNSATASAVQRPQRGRSARYTAATAAAANAMIARFRAWKS